MTTTPRVSRNKLKAFRVLYRSDRPLMAWELCRLAELEVQHSHVGNWLREWREQGITDRRRVYNQVHAYWLTDKGKEYAQSLEGVTP